MYFSTCCYRPQDNEGPAPLVGGGILERKIINARNGTEGNHAEDREMECCHHVLVGGDQFGGIHNTHPYITGNCITCHEKCLLNMVFCRRVQEDRSL